MVFASSSNFAVWGAGNATAVEILLAENRYRTYSQESTYLYWFRLTLHSVTISKLFYVHNQANKVIDLDDFNY